jgi:transcriptional regulator with XRE-family HTH domain
MADLQETLGLVIRRMRQDHQLTLRELAERSAVSEVYLGEVERGKKYPSARVLEQLAEGLETDVSDLLQAVAIELRGTPEVVMLTPIGFHSTPRRVANNPRASMANENVIPDDVAIELHNESEVITLAPIGFHNMPRRADTEPSMLSESDAIAWRILSLVG